MRKLILIGLLMATFSMFGTRTSVHTSGDEEGCKAYLGEANRLLCQVRKAVSFQSIPIYAMERKFEDSGVYMKATTVNGREYVDIYKPIVPPKEGQIEIPSNGVFFCGQDDITDPNGMIWRMQSIRKTGSLVWDKSTDLKSSAYPYREQVQAFKCAAYNGAIYTVGVQSVYNLSSYTWVRLSDWTIEKRNLQGKVIWTVTSPVGWIEDISVDSTGIYVVGGNYDNAPAGPNGRYVTGTRIEKRKLSDGSLIKSTVVYKQGVTIGYEQPFSCDIDSKNIYVGEWIGWTAAGVQKNQDRILTVSKKDLTLVSSVDSSVYSYPFTGTNMAMAYDVAVKDRTVSKAENVFYMSVSSLKSLDGVINIPLNYYGDDIGYRTLSIGVASDSTGIYTVGRGSTFYGWEVTKRDFHGNALKTMRFAGGGGLNGDGTANAGAEPTCIALDDDNVYVAGYQSLYHQGPFPMQQILKKSDLSIVKTNIATYAGEWWGVATYKSTMKIEKE